MERYHSDSEESMQESVNNKINEFKEFKKRVIDKRIKDNNFEVLSQTEIGGLLEDITKDSSWMNQTLNPEQVKEFMNESNYYNIDNKLLKDKIQQWSNSYLNLLSIVDHLQECNRKYNYIKDIKSNVEIIRTDDDEFTAKIELILRHELDKELCDLFLLLENYIDNEDLYKLKEERFTKFVSKGS
jgi:hypothetical protein